MRLEKWLVPSLILLSISIAFSGFFVGKSILALGKISQQVVVEQKINEDILSFSEAAVFLNISEEKLAFIVENSKLKDGKGIPYYKIDRNILFSRAALSKWIVYISENQSDY
ncbi:helix-turn-helix domain-containing protein [Clostridium formicaceticum]|uniref:Helix-turn-helix domain-containing protein n=1 Tax=Clostridium formicaceticum TaxID=1497 RepID=A0AAC9WFT7_9CLOT|nr:helix-turn-helix domain-containing protein [Clostridium formicaceticum]AOY76799.1 hypothetical protein BJL90_13620 [Clostridium formicaceticum]ARE87267.1 hypothetical protein CLFO_16660 [Clostridium formicaceticum]